MVPEEEVVGVVRASARRLEANERVEDAITNGYGGGNRRCNAGAVWSGGVVVVVVVIRIEMSGNGSMSTSKKRERKWALSSERHVMVVTLW